MPNLGAGPLSDANEIRESSSRAEQRTGPRPCDTSLDAARVQLELLRRLSPAERLEIAFSMSDAARELLVGRIRGEHPEWPERRVKAEAIRLMYGDSAVK